jgi:hypothetical protein
VALIEWISHFGEFEAPEPTVRDVKRMVNVLDRGLPFDLTDPAPQEMPSTDAERSTEAVRRALPQLVKLDRYERRAAARRNSTIQQIIARKTFNNYKL